jgi:hypothetical protein
MIVSASYRTDIPACYGDWFRARLAAGFVRVANPYGGAAYTVSLAPADVDGIAFWTRNAAPFMGALEEVRARGFPFTVSHTVTGYPRALEPSAPAAARAVETLRAIAWRFGPRACVWRYDPILETSLTPPDWHVQNFARLARSLAGAVDEAVVSWAQIYRKSARGLNAAARRHGFSWRDPDDGEKRVMLARLAAIAADQRMRLTVCSQSHLIVPGTAGAACVDAARLSEAAGRAIAARAKGNRPGCLCAESRDIGAYDTCPLGCAYCYAVSSRARAERAAKAIAANAESLTPPSGPPAPSGRPG